jgi:hypothetical protein
VGEVRIRFAGHAERRAHFALPGFGLIRYVFDLKPPGATPEFPTSMNIRIILDAWDEDYTENND